MTDEELRNYNGLIDEQVNLLVAEYSTVSKKWIRDEIVGALEDPQYSVNKTPNKIQFRAGTIIPDINIANNIVAAAINVAIGMVVGGGVAGVSAYVKKVGVQEAKKIFSKTIATKLKAWGLKIYPPYFQSLQLSFCLSSIQGRQLLNILINMM